MEQKRTGLSYVFTLAKEERGKLSLGMLLAVFSSALSFVPYLVVYQILLLIIKQEVTLPAMLGWAGIGIAAAVLQAILTSFAGICSHTAAFNTMHRIKVRVLEHMSKFNLGFFQEHAPGQIKTTLFDDVDRIETFLAHSTLELAQAIVVPLMMFIFMLRLNWIMALIMLVPMILGIAIPMALMGRYPDLTDEFAGDTEKLNASANEFITAMPVIKMYHLTAEKFEQYRNSLKIYTDCWIKMCESSCNPLSIALVVLDSAILFTLPVGGWLYLRDSLSAASYLLFILLTMCFFTSFLNMVTIAMQSMELGSGLDNVKKIMDMETMKNGQQTLSKTGCYGIDFDNVTFNYTQGGKDALSDVDIHLEPGSLNAFVGPSGAGKTTAVQLLGRYWDVSSGTIKIGGVPVALSWVVPCASTWGVVGLVSGTFFGNGAAVVVLALFAVAFLHIFITYKVFGRSLNKVEGRTGLIMELPPYHKPHWKSLFGSVFSKMGNVLSRALRIIICISVIFWLLSYSADGNVANSIIYKVGTFIEPVTSLFGLPWQLFIAFVASAMGKEASLGVMASLFNTGSIWAAIEQSATVDTAALSASMLSVISRPEALAFLFAFFFNMPCLMALTATTQETHSMKWTVRIALYYVLTALIMATIAYHVGLVIF